MRNLLLLLSALFLLVGCKESKRQQLNVFIWSEYLAPSVIKQFEEEFDCSIVIDTFETNEAMYSKLKFSSSGYDIVMPSNYLFDLMNDQAMLRPINFSTFSNIGYFAADKLERIGLKQSSFGLPYMISYTGLGLRKGRVKEFEPSWRIFDRKDLKGRMTMLNDMREGLGAALITLGYDINTVKKEELQQAVVLLKSWKKNLAKFESEQYKNGIASAEYLVVQGYNNDIFQVMIEESDVTFMWPKEGALFSVDFFAIPANAPHPKLAEEFLNFLLRPDIAAANMNFSLTIGFVTVDPRLLKPVLVESTVLDPPAQVAAKSQLIKNVGPSIELYIEAWERVLTER